MSKSFFTTIYLRLVFRQIFDPKTTGFLNPYYKNTVFKMTKTQVKRGGLLDLGFYRHAPLSGARIVNYSVFNLLVLRYLYLPVQPHPGGQNSVVQS